MTLLRRLTWLVNDDLFAKVDLEDFPGVFGGGVWDGRVPTVA